jgi:hypothetical protein
VGVVVVGGSVCVEPLRLGLGMAGGAEQGGERVGLAALEVRCDLVRGVGAGHERQERVELRDRRRGDRDVVVVVLVEDIGDTALDAIDAGPSMTVRGAVMVTVTRCSGRCYPRR